MQWIFVFLGGGLGALLRFGTSSVVAKWWQHVFPLATLLSNIFACLILGITITVLRDRIQQHEWLYAFIVIGICGGFSTFSSFANENFEFFEKGNHRIALLNILLSIGLCLGAVYLTRK